jgi:hydrogenase maturation factor HypE
VKDGAVGDGAVGDGTVATPAIYMGMISINCETSKTQD